MLQVPYFEVDAFTRTPFRGNPAGVCVLDAWLPSELMQSIAAENNLSETAFVVGGEGRYELRWFTPKVEVDLCGHATLATAHVLLSEYEPGRTDLEFSTASGPLRVEQRGQLLAMDLPARVAAPCAPPRALREGLGLDPVDVLVAEDFLVVFPSEEDVLGVEPDFAALAELDERGVIVTARGSQFDFVSRFFAPGVGIPEDPVTGSAHCTLVPYWAGQIGRNLLHARQVSARGGDLLCEWRGERCIIAGNAVVYLVGRISVPS